MIDGELSPKRELATRWHLDTCAVCMRFVVGVVLLKRAVGHAYHREVPPPAVRRTVSGFGPTRETLQRQSRRGALG